MTPEQALLELARRKCGADVLSFLRFVWWMPQKLALGAHTKALCARLTKANEDWRAGKSTFLLVAMPFRHGKSSIVSQAFPAFFLGANSDRQPDVILSGYGASLVESFSKKVKYIMRSDKYQHVFPGVLPGRGTDSAADWAVEGSSGAVIAQGLGGSITGRGGHLIVVDDYAKSLEEARSQTFRDKTWDGFRNDLMTRRNAPASIVVVCATPWHVDDIRGRILAAMSNDPMFPRFEELNFPATNKDGSFLFERHFGRQWYKDQYATLGRQASALMDCNPQAEKGERFDVTKVVLHHDLVGWPSNTDVRGWDLASSSAERGGSDPDWTWGIRACVTKDAKCAKSLWIKGMVATRSEAPERNALIVSTAMSDGPGVRQYVEAFGAYKDAYTSLASELRGRCVVSPSRLPGDKSAKAAGMEPCFDSGSVHVYVPGCGDHLRRWMDDFTSFPNGRHDDAVDATAVAFHASSGSGSTVLC